jgi:hypothetical protein
MKHFTLVSEGAPGLGLADGQKESRPKAAQFRVIRLFLLRIGGNPPGILEVASCVVRIALGLVDLAFGLQILVTHHLTGALFDRALGFLGETLDVFAVQLRFPFVACGREQCAVFNRSDAQRLVNVTKWTEEPGCVFKFLRL